MENKSFEIFQKMFELAEFSTINGIIQGDARSVFLGETIKVVLQASVDEKHATLMHQYVQNFLNQVAALNGEIKTVDLLKDQHIPN